MLGLLLLPFLSIPIVLLIFLATLDTKHFGLFTQVRIGQHGRPFRILKIRTLREEPHRFGQLDASASVFGRFLRTHRLDELPQLFNVILGTMSFVGPRPDVPGFADCLSGADRIILKVKPGVTGPATLAYQHEAQLLLRAGDAENYNRSVIWPDKVKINKTYVKTWRFSLDLKFIFQLLFK